MKEELKKILEDFIEETQDKRTHDKGDHNESISSPSFQDLLEWLEL